MLAGAVGMSMFAFIPLVLGLPSHNRLAGMLQANSNSLLFK
jgi:hypothetical protein